jgi:hypothetical protein
MPIRYPIEYDLNPKRLEPGWRWLTASLKNLGSEDLVGLDVRLNSLDEYNLRPVDGSSYLPLLTRDEEWMQPFQVAANLTARVYLSVEGVLGSQPFHWESPAVSITVGEEVAELVSLFAMSEPYPPVGEVIRVEATLRGLAPTGVLDLQFWADSPDGHFRDLGAVRTKALSPGEQTLYAAEFTPEEEGLYTLYAYVYDGIRRIGRETEVVYVKGA